MSDLENNLKTCWSCKHFAFDRGYGSSEDVSGDPFSIRCNVDVATLGSFRYSESGIDEDDFREIINQAATCPDFKGRGV